MGNVFNIKYLSSTTEDTSDFPSALEKSPEVSVYDKLGFSEEQIALGVDPDDVLEWLGTKDDLLTKFVGDNPQFDDERAETEVMKFMMDAEMVNKYIAFEKEKEKKYDGVALRAEAG